MTVHGIALYNAERKLLSSQHIQDINHHNQDHGVKERRRNIVSTTYRCSWARHRVGKQKIA